LKKNKALKRDIDNNKKITITNGRKVYYEDQEINNLNFYQTIIKVIYYLLLVVYIILGSFVGKKEYKNWKVWIIMLLYILLPFILNNLMNKIVGIWDDYIN
jgi:magnesium-transporting ATPase (P-type)